MDTPSCLHQPGVYMLLHKSSSCSTVRHIPHMKEVGRLETKSNILHHTYQSACRKMRAVRSLGLGNSHRLHNSARVCDANLGLDTSMQCQQVVTQLVAQLQLPETCLLESQLSHESHRQVD